LISWIKGEVIDLWQTNSKFFVLINCQNLGYEIQILESIFIKLKTKEISGIDFILWLKHIKKEDSDSFFGFYSKFQRDFFVDILNIKGVGSQIGMAMLNKLSIEEIINAITTQNKKTIGSVPGIGQKMTERIILELKSKFKVESQIVEEHNQDQFLVKNIENNTMFNDLQLTLQSLNYSKKEINNILPIIIKETNFPSKKEENISFENLLKLAMNYLDSDSSNIDR
jgi:Holliday junction DNA helicase RuvA